MDAVERYIQQFPPEVQEIMQKIRTIIKKNAAEVVETISYGMPGYKIYGRPLIYFAGYKHHIGIYATPSGHKKFEKELSQYKQGKGSVQFPLNQPIPFKLIEELVRFRVEENKIKL